MASEIRGSDNFDSGAEAITLGTEVATTSGTAIDFTGIPAGVKRITVMFNGVSTSGTSQRLIQIGPVGGIETSSYVSSSVHFNASALSSGSSTVGFIIRYLTSSDLVSGVMTLNRLAGNRFVSGLNLTSTGTSVTCAYGSGNKLLAGELSVVRLTTVNGTDTFDAGSINISWE